MSILSISAAAIISLAQQMAICDATVSIKMLSQDQVTACSNNYRDVKASFLSKELLNELQAIEKKGNTRSDADYRRQHEILLVGYADWKQWQKDNDYLQMIENAKIMISN